MPKLSQVCLVISIFFLYLFVLGNPLLAVSNGVVISQIQVAKTGQADYEFVELFNSSSNPINLSGFRLTKRTSSGTQSNLVASMSGVINPNSYFLIAHPSYSNSLMPADLLYSATSSGIATNNTLTLYQDAGLTILDQLGFGSASYFESSPSANPTVDQVLLRVGTDTDNNLLDFVLSTPNPRNSLFIVITPTPSPTPTPTTEITPTPTIEPTPTVTPEITPTPTPTIEPTPSPTPTQQVTPTPTPEYQKHHHHLIKFYYHCLKILQKFHHHRS